MTTKKKKTNIGLDPDVVRAFGITKYDGADHLASEEVIAEFLAASAEMNDPEVMAHATADRGAGPTQDQGRGSGAVEEEIAGATTGAARSHPSATPPQ